MSIVTKQGDKGKTAASVCGGIPVAKNASRITAYGSIDELNSALGLVRSHNKAIWLEQILERLQQDLFLAGADLATPFTAKAVHTTTARIQAKQIAYLAEQIEQLENQLTPLRHFILPTGNPTAAALHLARSICRRTERCCVALSDEEEISAEILRYFNRLSDLLFLLARSVNKKAKIAEKEWHADQNL